MMSQQPGRRSLTIDELSIVLMILAALLGVYFAYVETRIENIERKQTILSADNKRLARCVTSLEPRQ